jgi:hypothetical protein
MTIRARLLTAVILLFVALPVVNAQAPKDKSTKEPANKARPTKTTEAEAAAALERRNVAVSLLTSLADDARAFHDQKLRARVLARTADALWTTEPDRAHELFRRAWDAAETGDAEATRQAAEDARKQQQQTGVVVRRGGRDMRSEVLRIVAKRDSKLAEEFLKKLEEQADRDAKEAATDANLKRGTDQWSAPAAVAKRLALARQLLQDGDVERALQYAGLAIFDQVNKDTIGFLSALRPKNAPAADTAFNALLGRSAQDPAADANTVAGLSSYAFTPLLYITFTADGGSYANQEGPLTGPPDLSPQLRAAFFQVAGGILMRPLPPPDQDVTTSGRTGKYMVIKRLLPLFEQYSPDQAALLRTEMTALVGNLPDPNIVDGNHAIDRGIVPDNPTTDPVQSMQNRLDHAKTSAERDAIYADVASALGGKGDPQARELASKIEDSEMRKNVLAYVDFELLRAASDKKDVPEIIRIAKTGELTHIQRAWAYAQAARLVSSADGARAADYLQEAAAEARRIEGSDPDRARGLVAVATGFARADRVRAWELISEAIKVANGVERFTGEDGQLSARLATKNMIVSTNTSDDDFDVAGVFTTLAGDDLYRSIELAKTFTGENARANAMIAVARSVLDKKPQKVASAQ